MKLWQGEKSELAFGDCSVEASDLERLQDFKDHSNSFFLRISSTYKARCTFSFAESETRAFFCRTAPFVGWFTY
jgi:hypothetical protein